MSNGYPEVAACSRQRDGHPTERALRRFVVGTTSPAENRVIVAHLLRRCDRCSKVVAEAIGEPSRAVRRAH